MLGFEDNLVLSNFSRPVHSQPFHKPLYFKGLQRQRFIGSAVAGFNDARTITKASAAGLDTRTDDYNKGICSPRSLVNNPVR